MTASSRRMASTQGDCGAPVRTLSFRITGAASVKRIEPLLQRDLGHRIAWSQPEASGPRKINDGRDPLEEGGGLSSGGGRFKCLDFVWETTVTKEWKDAHRAARVLNRLSGAQVLEDKGNLAILQHGMHVPTLTSYVVRGREAVREWAQRRWGTKRLSGGKEHDFHYDHLRLAQAQQEERGVDEEGGDWWCAKATGGNGGMDIWVLHKGNWDYVTHKLNQSEEYIIQSYIVHPLLWRGCKFHFRVYAALSADLRSWMYRQAYILSASRPYTHAPQCEGEAVDELVHISNLAVNKHTPGHPGQVPCNLPAEYPLLWPRITALLGSLVEAAAPFMAHQAKRGHFEFLGLDVIADAHGGAWLMEVNRLPGLQSSQQNKEAEDKFYDSMMLDLVRLLVLPHLVGCHPNPGDFEAVSPPNPLVKTDSTETWRNVMRFAAYKRGSRHHVPIT